MKRKIKKTMTLARLGKDFNKEPTSRRIPTVNCDFTFYAFNGSKRAEDP